MQLKKLEMCGFKSFAQKTEIAFEPGVTCIVGPNGCGKSNVVDAIKWVLGTLSHKSVRGEEMLDVIFKGAEGVGPAGMAEVSLTLDNSDRALPMDFSEVTITRRLHRSGEGEYLINRTACRLKDIRDLLYGTGIGTDNYSIIEQGKIDRLVTSDPKSRRLVFDEAAGISKYRARKRETENRLEKVTQDLARVSDVVREVQRELRSVRSQAGRAARYRELQAEYKDKRGRSLRHEHETLLVRTQEISTRIAGLESRKAARESGLAARRAETSRLEREVRERGDRHTELAGEWSARVSRAEYLAQAVGAAEQRLAELEETRARAEGERDAAAGMLAAKRGDLDAAGAERDRAQEELVGLERRAEDLARIVEEAAAECRRAAEAVEARKAEAIDLASREARYRNDLAQAKADLEAGEQRRRRAEESERRVEGEIAEIGPRAAAAREEGAGLGAVLADLKHALQASEAEQASLKEEIARLDTDLVQLRGSRDRSESRRETLRELEVGLEGLGLGARKILKAGLPGLCGTVADLIEAPADRVAAVEAVLGDSAGALVFESAEQVRLALQFLAEQGLPRTALVALDRCRPSRAGGPTRLSAAVRCEERFRTLADGLLGGAVVAAGAGSADLLASLGLTAVTPSGDVYDATGLVATGRRAGGLVSRKTELKTLEQEIGEFMALIGRLEQARTEAARRATALETSLKEQRHAIYDQSVALTESQKELEKAEQRLQWLETERAHLSAERRQIESERAAVESRRSRLEALAAELGLRQERITAEIRELAESVVRAEAERDRLRQALGGLQVERATAEEKRQSAARRVGMIETEMESHRETVRRQEEHLAQTEGRLGSAQADLESRRTERAAADEAIAAKKAEVDRALSEREAAQAALEAARAKAAELQRESDAAGAEMQDARVEEAQTAAAMSSVIERAREEAGLELSAEIEIEADEQGEPLFAIEEEVPEAEASAGPEAPVDWEAMAREAEELRAKIAGFGAVNVVALEQLDELEKREKDLLTQQQDIEAGKRELEELIRRIDRESKVLFERTLEYVRGQFSTIFRKVFGGGKADIVLQQEEGVDPLDQGLEVMVRIPQREMMPISSLSGGQKTLTAFSLVMSLFRANPSPFCVLDEADAALDEANVDKYAALINEFVTETQFIVISHNKRTMAAADVLYGVTMEKPGVSRKVAVDLSGAEGMEALKKRREELMAARAEATARKASELAAVRQAADQALEAEERGEPVAVAAPAEPKPEEPDVLDPSKLTNPFNYSTGGEGSPA